MPAIPKDLLEYLEDFYPPKCFEGKGLEEHLMYAGVVRHVVHLRSVYDQQQQEEAVDAMIADGLDPYSGEPAVTMEIKT